MTEAVTKNYRLCSSPDRLAIVPRKRSALTNLVIMLLTFGLLDIISIMGLVVYHRAVLSATVFLSLQAVFLVPFLWGIFCDLSRPTVSLDRLHNRVSLGAKSVCDLTQIDRVEINKYFFRLRKGSARMTEIRLMVRDEKSVMLLGSVAYTPEEVEQLAQAISDFARAELVWVSEQPGDRTDSISDTP